MERIAIRISQDDIEGQAYDPMASEQFKFECLDFKRPIIKNVRDTGTLLSGRIYSHLISKSKVYRIVISSNELNDNTIDFLENFWDAQMKYISIYDGQNWSNYIRVFTEDGDFPISFVEDVGWLPEIELNLISRR